MMTERSESKTVGREPRIQKEPRIMRKTFGFSDLIFLFLSIFLSTIFLSKCFAWQFFHRVVCAGFELSP